MGLGADRTQRNRTGNAGRSGDRDESIDLAEYIRRVGALCGQCDPERLPVRIGREVRRLLAARDWLPEDRCRPGAGTYRRHLLHVDPRGRFTVLAVVWRPGQGTPLHGHTAWGVVGVYEGRPSIANYRLVREGTTELACEAVCRPGDVSCVQPGIDYPHRVFNASDELAISIHTYGRDLAEDPSAINIPM